MTIARSPSGLEETGPIDPLLDHLVYAVPDLAEAVAEFASATGVAPVPGGRHLGRGTRNHLVGLGPTSYLEIIGPDVENPVGDGAGVPFGIDTLASPRLVTWAVRPPDIVAASAASATAGADLGGVRPWSRRTPDGGLLEWHLASVFPAPFDGVTPFLIDWGATPHPARTLPRLRLLGFRATHPDPAAVSSVTEALAVRLKVSRGPAALQALIDSPRGLVSLS
ncbi:VOC family protein [Pseudonocardia spinosispora]|uniref:VOC family protein n=1 Tax=Pseudonocardia spinosispora TaxID=103441 RepID=UPI00041BD6AE|nr:VOC family protein [Pseudonocardia spinosispora]